MRRSRATNMVLVLGISLLILMPVRASRAADKYPSHPMQLICAFPAGGAADVTNRIWARFLEKRLGTTVVPVNKPGGGGVIGVTAVVTSAPDGYTLGNHGDHMVSAILLGQATYAFEDLRVVSQVTLVSNTIAVNADSPWKTFQDLVDYAKKNPGMKYGHQGIGSSAHLRMENLNKLANLKMIGVPFKGDGETVPAVLGKHVPLAIVSTQAAKPQADAGKMRILFSFEPPAAIGLDPSIPDFIGVFGKDAPDIDIPTYLVVPSKTPEQIVRTLKKAMEEITKEPEFIKESQKLFMRVNYVDGDIVMKTRLPNKMVRLKALYKEIGMLK